MDNIKAHFKMILLIKEKNIVQHQPMKILKLKNH